MAADVATTLAGWSSTSNSNAPAGSTAVGANLDDNLREIQGVTVRGLSHKGADIASAGTTDLGAIEGLAHDITGTTTITSFGTVRAGIWKIIKFENALTLTHNATSLILPGGANITTADGDVAIVASEGSGNWRCLSYVKASGLSVISEFPVADSTVIAKGSADATKKLRFEVDGITTGTTRVATWPDKDGTVAMTSDVATISAANQSEVNAGTSSSVFLSPLVNLVVNGTAQATTSGTAITFSGFPAGTRRITVNFMGVSTNGTNNWILQVGDSGGVETSGYLGTGVRLQGGAATAANFTTGFGVNVDSASAVMHGSITLSLADGTTWAASGNVGRSDTAAVYSVSGSKALSAELDRISLTTVGGTDAFDAGSINIQYER